MTAWVVGILAVLVTVVVLALFIGSRLPRDHVAAVRARIAARPADVWAVISDPAQAATWRRDLRRVRLLAPQEGRTAWEEESGNGIIRYVMAEADPPRHMVTRITSGLAFGGQWEFALAGDEGGNATTVTITERGFVNPALFRFMARYVFGYTSSLAGYLRALGAKFGQSVTPEVIG